MHDSPIRYWWVTPNALFRTNEDDGTDAMQRWRNGEWVDAGPAGSLINLDATPVSAEEVQQIIESDLLD